MTIFDSNLETLRSRFPALAERVGKFPAKESVAIFKAQDGSVCYGIRQGTTLVPVMNHISPAADMQAQINSLTKELSDMSRPVLMVGLYPGNELAGIFDLCENTAPPRPEQQIHVCIDSTICLYAFLKTWDVSRILSSKRVNMFWHEDMPKFMDKLLTHPEIPHIFTLITGANDNTLSGILPPLAKLVAERDAETERLKKENDDYYDAISDQELARIIGQETGDRRQEAKNLEQIAHLKSHTPAFSQSDDVSKDGLSALSSQPSSHISPIPHQFTNTPTHERTISPPLPPRPPRLMMPTCSWSTFIQHSTRDTCAAFEDLGWEVCQLKMDAMLTPYHLVRQINEFKPDVFLFIDHMRYEAEDVYPRNMMFVTWIQDDMPNLQCKKAGTKLAEYAQQGKRDLVVGYTERLETEYDFPADRLIPINIPADPRIFHPVTLTGADQAKYACDLAFMSNVSTPSEQVVEKKIVPFVKPLGLSNDACMLIHDDLWKLYRAGDTLTDRKKFLDWLMTYPEFREIWNDLQPNSELGQKAGDMGQEAGDRRQGTGDRRQEAGDRRQEAGDRGQEAGDRRQEAGNREQILQTRDDLMRLFYWRLNDTIYRHIVLEWADEVGLKINLYGHGWENHPQFSKYARGALAHGPDLNTAYQAAGYNLHLNITSGMHQRIWEILTSDATLLTRAVQRNAASSEPPAQLMRKLAATLQSGSTQTLASALEETMANDDPSGSLTDWVFNIALATARRENNTANTRPDENLTTQLAEKTLMKIETTIMSRPDWIIEEWEQVSFTDRNSFLGKVLQIKT